MNKLIDGAGSRHKSIKNKIERILKNPSQNDMVYQSFNRIFAANTPLNLRRPDKTRLEIRRLARKRFALGYPPRKPGETSFGDAINWEWIVRCAQHSPDLSNVLIVSRDGDYGISYGKDTILNDWLESEFKARVSKKRKIHLTQRLNEGLALLDEVVTDQEKAEEEKIIASVPRRQPEEKGLLGELFERILKEQRIRDLELSQPTLAEMLASFEKNANEDDQQP